MLLQVLLEGVLLRQNSRRVRIRRGQTVVVVIIRNVVVRDLQIAHQIADELLLVRQARGVVQLPTAVVVVIIRIRHELLTITMT